MATLGICASSLLRPWASAREAEAARVLAPAPSPREESPLLNANAAEALVLAASPIAEDRAGRRVVAVVLEDGTVVEEGRQAAGGRRFEGGTVAGRNWTLWWERRAQISEL